MEKFQRSFLKWAGSKFQVLSRILNVLTPANRLIEPFVGSGVVFLNTHYSQSILADSNSDLINVFQQLKENGSNFISYANRYFVAENNCEARFYELRDKFNTTKNLKQKAALFIYLNRHGYNGLIRYNSSGEFNVPFGRYTAPSLPASRMLKFHERFKSADLLAADFAVTMDSARKGDIVYCDPPYVPLSASANFTAYHTGGFNETMQLRLAAKAKELANKNIPVIISNHDTSFTREAYQGAEISSFEVNRYISRDATNRKPATELLAVFR